MRTLHTQTEPRSCPEHSGQQGCSGRAGPPAAKVTGPRAGGSTRGGPTGPARVPAASPKEQVARLAWARTQPTGSLGPTARHLGVNLKLLTFYRVVMKQTEVLGKEQCISIFSAFLGIDQYCFKVNKSVNVRW